MNESTASPPARPTSPFWTFSLRLYRMEGVAPACLALQDGAGVDVNVLLFSLFAADAGRGLSAADMAHIVAAVDVWRVSAVVPLRSVRQFLRAPPASIDAADAAALRLRVKAIELEAERLQQAALYEGFPLGAPEADRNAAAQKNVAVYQAHLGAAFDSVAVETLLANFAKLGDHPS